jgi:hypothetical protein
LGLTGVFRFVFETLVKLSKIFGHRCEFAMSSEGGWGVVLAASKNLGQNNQWLWGEG